MSHLERITVSVGEVGITIVERRKHHTWAASRGASQIGSGDVRDGSVRFLRGESDPAWAAAIAAAVAKALAAAKAKGAKP